jgi:hypothetical protein
LQAQEIVLKSIEGRVLGLAEASATPFEKLTAQFEQIGDAIGEAMLPALEDVNREVSAWLSTPQGRKDVEAIADAFIAGATGVRDMAKFLKDVKGFLDGITRFNMGWVNELVKLQNFLTGRQNNARGDGSGRGTEPFGGTSRGRAQSGPVINFNAPIDSVSAGREVARVLADYNRASGIGRGRR